MIATLQHLFDRAFERLAQTVTTYVPPLLAGLVILLAFYLVAVLVRLLANRIFKGAAVDRFLHQSGLSTVLTRSGRLRTTRIVSGVSYWLILGAGFLTALNAFDTELTSKMIEGAVFLMPKLVTAGAILVAGAWLGQYLGRSALIWACNEGVPWPGTLAAGVRMLIVFVAVVVAAEHLNFAQNVFLAAFILVVGGLMLTFSIAVGLSARDSLKRLIRREAPRDESSEAESLWKHL